MRLESEDYQMHKPNSDNALLYGEQYSANFFSYLNFCKIMADREEMKEYVLMNFDELDAPAANENSIEGITKPSESYALLIYKALDSSKDGKLTLSEIYLWIEKNYPYYQTADPVWKNSIRHNLSLNPTFTKIPRPISSKGKGGYWAIDKSQRQGKILKSSRKPKTYERSSISNDMINITANKMIF